MITEKLEPKRVFYHFEKLCEIPHGSGNEKGVSDYCRNFAESLGLRCIQDSENNIIIFKPASKGFEAREPIILQGHLDMVCAVRAGVNIDMAKEPLKLKIYGDSLGAEDTSLGGDDGIAVAYALALLESDDIPHPPLEILLTTNEEVGLTGAALVDTSVLKGKRLINLDSEEQGVFTVGCAGGVRVYTELPVVRDGFEGDALEIVIGGLIGGHSGAEIDKGRANSNIEMGRLLKGLADAADIRIFSLAGGDKDNVITPYTKAVIGFERGKRSALLSAFEEYKMGFFERFGGVEKTAEVNLSDCAFPKPLPLDKDSTARLINMLFDSPYGVQKMSPDIQGLVQTSLNLGVLRLEADRAVIDYSVRSSLTAERDELSDSLCSLADRYGAAYKKESPYPAWEYKKDSPLRDKMVEVWRKMTGENPVVCTIHAGLECGLLSEKIKGLDAVSIGPDMQAIHSCEERLNIKSVGMVWEFLKRLLAELN